MMVTLTMWMNLISTSTPLILTLALLILTVINVDCGTDDDDGTVVGDTGKTLTDVMTLLYHKVIQWRDHCNKRHHGQEVTQGQRNWADRVGNCFPTCVNNYGGLGSCLATPSSGRYITS